MMCSDRFNGVADVTDVQPREVAQALRGAAPPLAAGTALVVTPHPLRTWDQQVLDAVAAPLVPGDTLADFVGRYGVLPGRQWRVSIGGAEVPEAMWHRVRPKHGHLVECRRVPEKEVLRLAAMIALAYFTFGAGGLAGGGFMGLGTGIGAQIAASVAYMAGSLVINKLLGPKTSRVAETSTSPTYSLQSGGRNRSRLFEPLGLVLGEPYGVPDLASLPYTWFENGEQYLYQVFHCGLNCAAVDGVRIGQTAIGSFEGVALWTTGGEDGLPGYGTNVDSLPGGSLTAPAGFGPWVQRTSSEGTVVLAVDLVANLYRVNDGGGYTSQTLDLGIEYRPLGSPTWLPFVPGREGVAAVTQTVQGDQFSYEVVITPGVEAVPASVLRLDNASQKPVRRTVELGVPIGQYEVRLQKRHQDETGTRAANTVEWSQLRSIQVDTATYSGQTRLAVKMQASGQLNGSLEELNVQLHAAAMPYWNGSAWTTATSRSTGLCNPGAIFLQLARGIYVDGRLAFGLGLEDAQIDIEGLQLFMVRCAAKGFDFDLFLQEAVSIGDLLASVAAAGLGDVAWPDGRLGVVWFTETDPLEAVLNMGTIKARSFSVDYDTAPTAEEIEAQYFDRLRGNAWKSVRVTAPGVATPNVTARTRLDGVTSETHAAVLARFSMAQNVYQRKTVTCEVDLEHMTFRRGTVLAMSHDITQWGYGGRVQAAVDNAGTVTLTLDDAVPAVSPFNGATSRYIGLRLPGETQMRVFPIAAFAGTSRTVTLATAWPGGATLPGSTGANPAWDTVWVYDFKATPGQKMRVAGVSPTSNLSGARVTLVPETDEFWTYVWSGAYSPPPNNTLLQSGLPVLRNVLLSEQLLRQGNTWTVDLGLTWSWEGALKRTQVYGTAAGADAVLQWMGETTAGAFNWRGALDEVWTIELRPFGDTRVGDTVRLRYAVQGLRRPPDDVSSLAVDADGLATWVHEKPMDHAGYELRWQQGNNTSWGDAAPLHDGLVTDSPWLIRIRPSGVATIMVKAVDTTGNRSANANAIVVNLGDPVVQNVVTVTDWQAAGFPGAVTGASVVAGDLVATADASPLAWSSTPEKDAWSADPTTLAWLTVTYQDAAWTPPALIVDAADDGVQLTLDLAISAGAWVVEYRRDGDAQGWTADSALAWQADPDTLAWHVEGWRPWPGAVTARAGRYEFRVMATGRTTQAQITTARAVLDVPDQFENVGLVDVAALGTVVPTAKVWRAITGIGLTLVADGGAARTARVDDRPSRLITTRDASNTAVTGTVLATLQGY